MRSTSCTSRRNERERAPITIEARSATESATALQQDALDRLAAGEMARGAGARRAVRGALVRVAPCGLRCVSVAPALRDTRSGARRRPARRRRSSRPRRARARRTGCVVRRALHRVDRGSTRPRRRRVRARAPPVSTSPRTISIVVGPRRRCERGVTSRPARARRARDRGRALERRARRRTAAATSSEPAKPLAPVTRMRISEDHDAAARRCARNARKVRRLCRDCHRKVTGCRLFPGRNGFSSAICGVARRRPLSGSANGALIAVPFNPIAGEGRWRCRCRQASEDAERPSGRRRR